MTRRRVRTTSTPGDDQSGGLFDKRHGSPSIVGVPSLPDVEVGTSVVVPTSSPELPDVTVGSELDPESNERDDEADDQRSVREHGEVPMRSLADSCR